jgi:hypothetical protein
VDVTDFLCGFFQKIEIIFSKIYMFFLEVQGDATLHRRRRLTFSPLDTRFLLRDLIGSGHIKIVQTPTGLLARVSRD